MQLFLLYLKKIDCDSFEIPKDGKQQNPVPTSLKMSAY